MGAPNPFILWHSLARPAHGMTDHFATAWAMPAPMVNLIAPARLVDLLDRMALPQIGDGALRRAGLGHEPFDAGVRVRPCRVAVLLDEHAARAPQRRSSAHLPSRIVGRDGHRPPGA